MKYWAYLAAKLGGAILAFLILFKVTTFIFVFNRARDVFGPSDPFVHDLPYTMSVMFDFLVLVALGYLAIWDQRLRCRSCLRHLRMPVNEGGWDKALFAPPRTGYICPFGHGTLVVPELKRVNHDPSNWEQHDDDIWKELYAVHDSDK